MRHQPLQPLSLDALPLTPDDALMTFAQPCNRLMHEVVDTFEALPTTKLRVWRVEVFVPIVRPAMEYSTF